MHLSGSVKECRALTQYRVHYTVRYGVAPVGTADGTVPLVSTGYHIARVQGDSTMPEASTGHSTLGQYRASHSTRVGTDRTGEHGCDEAKVHDDWTWKQHSLDQYRTSHSMHVGT
eukprot:1495307-Rhodomonas_salina.4